MTFWRRWGLPIAPLALLSTIPALGPQVVARVAGEPLLITTGVVRRQNSDLLAGAPRTRATTLLGIQGTLRAVRHAVVLSQRLIHRSESAAKPGDQALRYWHEERSQP